MKKVDLVASVLILVGAINWGLIGLLDFDAIEYVLSQAWLDRLAYILIGVAAIYKIANWQHRRSS